MGQQRRENTEWDSKEDTHMRQQRREDTEWDTVKKTQHETTKKRKHRMGHSKEDTT